MTSRKKVYCDVKLNEFLRKGLARAEQNGALYLHFTRTDGTLGYYGNILR